MTTVVPCASATGHLLDDIGADVIKIEPPAGDNTRYISVGPAPGMSGVFVNVNRGKRSVVLDLQAEEGRAALARLAAKADVMLEAFRPGVAARLGPGLLDRVIERRRDRLTALEPRFRPAVDRRLHLNVSWLRALDPDEEDRRDRYRVIVGYSQSVAPSVVVVLDYIRQSQERREWRASNVVEAGLRYQYTDAVTLGAGAGFGGTRPIVNASRSTGRVAPSVTTKSTSSESGERLTEPSSTRPPARMRVPSGASPLAIWVGV